MQIPPRIISRDVEESDKRALAFGMLESLGDTCTGCFYKHTKFCKDYCPENKKRQIVYNHN